LEYIFGPNAPAIKTEAVYYQNSMEPVNVGGYDVKQYTIRPWETDRRIIIRGIYTQANEVSEFNEAVAQQISSLLPLEIQFENNTTNYYVFFNPVDKTFMNIRNHRNIPDEDQVNYQEIYNTEQKLATSLNKQKDIFRKLVRYPLTLVNDDEFVDMIRESSELMYPVPYQVREVKRGLGNLFRRRRRKRYVTVTKYRRIPIKDIADEELKEKAVRFHKYRLERILNRSPRNRIRNAVRRTLGLYNRSATHNEGLQAIKNFWFRALVGRR
jgi:hypothetical protein